MPPLLEQLPALAVPAVEALEADVPVWKATSLRIGENLAKLRRLGLIGASQTALIDFCNRLGLSAAEARQFADVGAAVERLPQVAAEVRAGDVSVQGAGQLGRVAKVVPAAELPKWLETAKSVPAQEMKTLVDKQIEAARTGEPSVETLTLHVPGETRRNFARARDVACRKAGTVLTEGQTLTVVVEHYLDDFDPARVKPGKRRMADTNGLPGRNHPVEVVREVLKRTGGRCNYPGCTNEKWVQMAHGAVPHRLGGSREAANTWGLCPYHHVRYDRGEFTIRGTPDAPEFYDAKGRRIGANGRILEGGGGGERAPP